MVSHALLTHLLSLAALYLLVFLRTVYSIPFIQCQFTCLSPVCRTLYDLLSVTVVFMLLYEGFFSFAESCKQFRAFFVFFSIRSAFALYFILSHIAFYADLRYAVAAEVRFLLEPYCAHSSLYVFTVVRLKVVVISRRSQHVTRDRVWLSLYNSRRLLLVLDLQ